MDVDVSLDLKVAMQLKALVKGKARCVLPLSPSPSASRRPPTPSQQRKCRASRGLCDLHAVDVRGADLGTSCSPGDKLGFLILCWRATALAKWPEIWLNSLPPLIQRATFL